MLRLFFPLIDTNDRARRWSSYLADGMELAGSTDWFELWDRHAESERSVEPAPIPARGRLDPLTARAFTDALMLQASPDTVLHCLCWEGYGSVSPDSGGPTVHQFGHDFVSSDLTIRQLMQKATSDRIPEFAHDDLGNFAWGTNLYPDSLIIASAEPIYRALINDPRLDTVTIRKQSDLLPVSSGD
jgi:hypothetical protein